MTSISPPFPTVINHRTNPKFIATNRLNHRSSTNLFHHSLSRVSLSVCRCSNGNGFQESVRSVIKWFDEYVIGYKKYEMKDDNDDDGESEDWDWERWKKHFLEVDEQERIVSILKSHLDRAILKEDYEDAARIKVAIAAAATNDTVGRVMSYLSRAVEEERYMDAAFVRDSANAGLVGWWAGISDDNKDPYGRIIRISAEHGRYLARSYSPRQLATASDGAPVFEVFLTMNENGEYKHQPIWMAMAHQFEVNFHDQAVYLKRPHVPRHFPAVSSKSSGLTSSISPPDTVGDKGDLFVKDVEDTDDDNDMDDDSDMADESAFENILRDMIPGAKDLKVKVLNVTKPGKIDTDLMSKVVGQIVDEGDIEEKGRESDGTDDGDESEGGTDEEKNDIDSSNSVIDGESTDQIAVKIVVGGLLQKVSNGTSRKELIRVPAKLEKSSRSSFSFSIEKEKQQVSYRNAESLKKKETRYQGNRSTDSVMLDLAKSIGKGKIPMKVLRDVGQLINQTINRAKNRQPLSGTTTFSRIELPKTRDPLNGLYVGAHGLYTSEVIQLRRKFGQWQDDGGMKELSTLKFYEYVEAVKLTGDPYVPAGQVAFRAKVGTKYQLPHKGIIPEEFGVIARYRGQGRLADPGYVNPRWVDGELVILDGKYIIGGPVVGFVYWAPEYQFLMFFNQLRLQN